MNWSRIAATVAVCFPFVFAVSATYALAVSS